MLPMDVAMDMSVQDVEVVQIAQNISRTSNTHYVLTCGISSDKTGRQFDANPYMDILPLLPRNDTFNHDDWHMVMAAATILQQAEHGQVEVNASGNGYTYRPAADDFEGEDRFTLQTAYEGQQFILRYRVYVSPLNDPNWSTERDCTKPPFIPFIDSSVFPPTLLSSAGISFSSLFGSALAQSTGTGKPSGT
jgi:hypothetical protein